MKALIITTSSCNRQELLVSLWKLGEEGIDYTILAPYMYFEMEKEVGLYSSDHTIDEFVLDPDEYDMLIVVGGNPRYTQQIYNNPNIYGIAKTFDNQGKIICAVCGSQVPIMNILRGRRVTVFPRKKMLKYMSQAGAIIEDKAIVVDRNLVTGKGEMMTEMMMEIAIELVKERSKRLKEEKLKESGLPQDGD